MFNSIDLTQALWRCWFGLHDPSAQYWYEPASVHEKQQHVILLGQKDGWNDTLRSYLDFRMNTRLHPAHGGSSWCRSSWSEPTVFGRYMVGPITEPSLLCKYHHLLKGYQIPRMEMKSDTRLIGPLVEAAPISWMCQGSSQLSAPTASQPAYRYPK